MNELHERINRVINTDAFEACLSRHGCDLLDFQSSWQKHSRKGGFTALPKAFQEAILAGEKELQEVREFALALERDRQIESGEVQPLTHEELMARLRQ